MTLSAKIEERDCLVPRVGALNVFVQNYFSPGDFLSVEIMIMKHFQWNLQRPTALHFLEALRPWLLWPDDLLEGRVIPEEKAEVVDEEFFAFIAYFADISLQVGTLDYEEHKEIYSLGPIYT